MARVDTRDEIQDPGLDQQVGVGRKDVDVVRFDAHPVDDLLDEGFSPPERRPATHDVGTTAAEQRVTPKEAEAMVKKGVERHARETGIAMVTVELMEELRKKRFGNDAPVFKFDSER